jgi:hypothetical protein
MRGHQSVVTIHIECAEPSISCFTGDEGAHLKGEMSPDHKF